MKRIICLLLALALTASLPAWAAETEASPQVLEIVGEVAAPEEPTLFATAAPVISVSVPDSGWVIVNPYRLDVERDGLYSNQQIVSQAMVLENQSAVPVQVDVRAAGSAPAGSEAVFVPAPPAPDAAGKEVFLFLEFQSFWGNDTLWNGQFTDAPNQLLVTPQGTEKRGVMTMEVGGRGALRLFGAAAEAPASMWTAADRVNTTVIFTFTAAGSREGGN